MGVIRRLFLMLGGLALLAGMWGGLPRLGWALPTPEAPLAAVHGPLMVSGFLGVLIGLERAVALGQRWTLAGPVLAGLGVIALVGGVPTVAGAALFAASSTLLLAVFVRFWLLRPDWSTALLVLGAALWLVGNGLWLGGGPLGQVVPWWAGFLVLTIAGERLELAQLLLRPRVRLELLTATGVVVTGLLVSLVEFGLGVRLAGLGLLAVAGWLSRYDAARRAVHRAGPARFSAACLLLGYLWLGLAGLLWLLGADEFRGGLWYDAMVHGLFVGFVFSMIFAHALTIVPAVSGLAVPFERSLYLPLALLHGSLLLRTLGDLATLPEARRWGGLLNAVAIVLFAVLTARAARHATAPNVTVAARPRRP